MATSLHPTTVRLVFAGRVVATVCLRHAGVLIHTVLGQGTVETAPRGRNMPACELCSSAGGAMIDDLLSDDPDRLHVLHESLGCVPADSDERALREVAIELAVRLVFVQLANVQPEDL